jgi:hypothetical protein
MMSSRRRWSTSVLVVAVAMISWWGVLDRYGEAYLDRAMTQAVAAFAIARGINAVLSVAKGSEVSVEPFGVGVSLAVGQILDPVDDLIERFSLVMLIAIVALGVQKLLLALGGTVAVNLFLSALAAVVLVSIWRPLWFRPAIARGAVHLLIVSVVLRFLMVTVALASDVVHSGLIGEQVQQTTEQLAIAEDRMTRLADDVAAESNVVPAGEVARAPWWTRLDEIWEDDDGGVDATATSGEQRSSWDPRTRLEALERTSAETIDHLLSLAAAFITQSVLLPILFLWLALRLSGRLLGSLARPHPGGALP